MEKWKIDVAVLCIFFARPEQFRQMFEQVKKARPPGGTGRGCEKYPGMPEDRG